ncbi:MAG: MFS transporter [Thermoplasmata archaeon]|nr:MFS transporter [Thermoplasmata archaeon]
MKPEAIQLLSNAGLFGPVIIVPLILQDVLGADKNLIGLIQGSFAAAGFVSFYMFGRAADVHGRRNILLMGLLLSGGATVLQVFSLMGGGLAMFAAVRVLVGFCSGMFPAALVAYVYDMKGKMGVFSAFGAAGWAVGNITVGMFGTFYEGAYVFSAAIIFISFAIAWTLPFPKEVRMEVPLFPVDLIRRNAPVYSAMLIRHTGANMIWVTYPLFLASLEAPPEWIGVIYAVNGFGQFAFMFLFDRPDPALLVAVGLVSSALTFFTFTLAGNYWEIIPSQVLLAFAWASLYVGSLRYVMDRNKEKATASAMLSSTMSISGILGPMLGGVAATAMGFEGTIWIATGASVVALVIFVYELDRSGELYRLRIRSRGPA